MVCPFREPGALRDLQQEIMELTLTVPGSMDRLGAPSFPWSPQSIEDLPEADRKNYLEALRAFRNGEWKESKRKRR